MPTMARWSGLRHRFVHWPTRAQIFELCNVGAPDKEICIELTAGEAKATGAVRHRSKPKWLRISHVNAEKLTGLKKYQSLT